MNKRGQYYLVTAIIFIGIFFILISVVNQSKKETNMIIYEISKEMKIESSKVIEYSAYTGNNRIEDFTKKYAEYAGQETNIYFITGNLATATQEVYNYTNGIKTTIPSNIEGNVLDTILEGQTYSFEFKKGENFYFVIIREENDEKYVLRG